ncbi:MULTISPECIES: ATP-binding protein [Desulfococcus]|uniref:4Fe-4S ferredoxin, iron-sulpur binding domain-containing protein n=1 Tax=Desulfococcus multivorans DSM 2059 TaxID=1121405 RepID=S7USQ7_DESML|nr:4Fe-4S binding protein [Desulfococcus multivorans]AOY58658.1 4Fe-4S ferredoxin, iron-sulpur binding domain protein [Desulfococcus multivorans]AQV00949.1 4Fe-4S ferredoxin [Desulfococcus multivorans]EPR35313.1 4Fe-4S ferredoxin, iron-sulpur binding domain-containing protein [Desulfococcus multivorans DSM 2059]SJZ45824.1 4Fe-4S dicluster domain-containing protein [Desulfococcus multivorans DSM 2059]
MKTVRKILEIDEEKCDGCGQCVPGCAEGALRIIDGKARIVEDRLCDGLGACIGECPQGALHIIEREADEFDEEAVQAYLEDVAKAAEQAPASGCGCPSAQVQVLAPFSASKAAPSPASTAGEIPSALTHWPIQIRLIPPNAPFLRNADLLILADCSAVAFPMVHQKLLKGKVVMMGCPKFDDAQDYTERFKAIFEQAEINSVTVVFMEVPCCSALPSIVRKGMDKAGRKIPYLEMVVGRKGEIIG